jgi:predicted ArsR family transcriptional regulator
LNAFVDFTAGELTRAELLVWLILYRDARDGVARTSQADMAHRAGCSVKTVRRAVDRLRQRGLLRVTYRGGVGRGASAYRIRAIPLESLGT